METKKPRSPAAAFVIVLLACTVTLSTNGAAFQAAETGTAGGGRGFDTWFLLLNPGEEEAHATLRYMTEGGSTAVERRVDVGPGVRASVFADESVEGVSFSTTVVSDEPLVVERAEYFEYRGGTTGGHAKPGVIEASGEWYFAEGCTADGFSTWLLVENPADGTATIDVTFMREGGGEIVERYGIAPMSRFTLDLGSVPGLGRANVSMHLTSDRPVIAERAMYFAYAGRIEGGDVVTGATAPSFDWRFAEGYSGGGFDTWVLLMNPNDRPLRAQVYLDTGDT
ncbi:MAG: hypothetical protein KKF41_11280 [Actinobacteria bacterium]|nr:hypothetical protein [Actinomycetota bacterium]MBU1944358.1 hypothetical protein [Actinomycetota bacterium]MBU2688157.1 hypothetical protein [Actinomycetota bacterium]